MKGTARKTLLLVEDNLGDASLLRETFNELSLHDTQLVHVKRMVAAEETSAAASVDMLLLAPGPADDNTARPH